MSRTYQLPRVPTSLRVCSSLSTSRNDLGYRRGVARCTTGAKECHGRGQINILLMCVVGVLQASTENRDSLAKIIYAKLFDWLVARINAAIGEDTKCAASVGVLDIYGFESFATNDFEQVGAGQSCLMVKQFEVSLDG